MLRVLSFVPVVVCLLLSSVRAEDPVFSGPQVGERLPALPCLGLTGDLEGKSFDLIETSAGGPVLIVFFHELTRPGFGLMRAVTGFAGQRAEQGMKAGVVFLTDDLTETTNWAGNVRQLFNDRVTYAASPDGKEGPGAYGLNRNVTLTILVADQGKVTANFALVQPQLQADGPKILRAIADVTGGGEIPSIQSLGPNGGERMRGREQAERERMAGRPGAGQRGEGRGEMDPELTGMLRAVINREADAAQVREAAAKVESYVADRPAARRELARIVTTIIDAGKLENYGTVAAQGVLRQWKEKYGGESAEREPSAPTKGDGGEE